MREPTEQTSSAHVEVEATARELLRRSTRDVHQELEKSLRVLSPELTTADYVLTLRRFLAAHAVIERQNLRHAEALDGLGFCWDQRRKVPLLRRDLDALREEWSAPSISSHVTEAQPGETTLAHALGSLYVIEGSTLGGVVISHHVASVLGLGPQNGASFFYGYGASTGARWKELCGILERVLVGSVARDAAVDAARATFRIFVEHLAG